MEERIEEILSYLPSQTRLVAVSKYHPTEAIIEAYEAGQRIFGESRVQELVGKYEELSGAYLDLTWHFIGHLPLTLRGISSGICRRIRLST